jgi:hypothetical protein
VSNGRPITSSTARALPLPFMHAAEGSEGRRVGEETCLGFAFVVARIDDTGDQTIFLFISKTHHQIIS